MLVLGCLVTVGRQNIVLADDDELDPECEEETSQLLKYSLQPSTLPYTEPDGETQKATYAMGCFWGVEALFGAQPGVVRVTAGYTGGTMKKPSYRYLGDHYEAVEIEFDPKVTKFSKLSKLFWRNHDPSTFEEGKSSYYQYRSAIFYHDEKQKVHYEEDIAGRIAFSEKVVRTKLLQAEHFYPAENYHQKYFLRQHDNLVSSLELEDKDFLTSSRTSRLLGYISGNGKEESFLEEVEGLGLTEQQIGYVKKVRNSKTEGYCGAKPPSL